MAVKTPVDYTIGIYLYLTGDQGIYLITDQYLCVAVCRYTQGLLGKHGGGTNVTYLNTNRCNQQIRYRKQRH